MKFRTNWNHAEFPKKYSKNTMKSETVPDQSMSVREIMQRHTSGLPVNVSMRVPVYHGEEDLVPDVRYMDLAEVEELRINTQEALKKIKAELARKKKLKKEQEDQSAQFRDAEQRKKAPAGPPISYKNQSVERDSALPAGGDTRKGRSQGSLDLPDGD